MSSAEFDAHLVLVHPEIPWNTGNAGRTCLALRARLHLVAPLGFSLEDRQVRRAGLDYWEHVPVTVHADWDEFESRLPELGDAWFLSPDARTTLAEAPLRRPGVFVLGSETAGLHPSIRRRFASALVRIPQDDHSVRSLNQSTAAALALYEFRRRFPMATI